MIMKTNPFTGRNLEITNLEDAVLFVCQDWAYYPDPYSAGMF